MQPYNGPIEVGRHVVVWGATGSGKTTFTRSLGGSLGLHVIQLDAIRHEEGWDSTDWPEFHERLVAALESHPKGWVTDGSYSRISAEYLSRADTLIWLHLPWRLSFWRLLKRTVWRAWTREPLYNESGPRESWRLSFASSRSILWWSISHHRIGVRATRERIDELQHRLPVYELHSSAEVRAFLAAVEADSPTHPN